MLIGWLNDTDEENARHGGGQSFGKLVARLIKGGPRHENDISRAKAERELRKWLIRHGAHVLKDDGSSAGSLRSKPNHRINVVYDESYQETTNVVLPDQIATTPEAIRNLGGYFMRRCM